MPYANIESKRAYENRRYHAHKKTKSPAGIVKFNSKNLQPMLCKWGKS